MLLTKVELPHCMRPSIQPAATRVTSLLGSNVILRCEATGYPTPTLTWVKTSNYAGKAGKVDSDLEAKIVVLFFELPVQSDENSFL